MWTEQERIQHGPRDAPYPSDVTDEESIIAPLVPPTTLGRLTAREVMNAARYVLRRGCQWRQLPRDFPPLCSG
jgi:putative transposase